LTRSMAAKSLGTCHVGDIAHEVSGSCAWASRVVVVGSVTVSSPGVGHRRVHGIVSVGLSDVRPLGHEVGAVVARVAVRGMKSRKEITPTTRFRTVMKSLQK